MTALRPRSAGPGRVPGAALAIATALAMIAYQVGAKATRDALFLSSFPVSALPAMTIAAAVFSILMAFIAARALTTAGPERTIPLGFAGSAALLLGEWALVNPWPRGAAVAVYLHYSGLGALLISGFWAFLNERFDPRTAKRTVGRVVAGGTVGGLVGGALAGWVGSRHSVATMLPLLAVLHGTCAWMVWQLRRTAPVPHGPGDGWEAAPTTGAGAAGPEGGGGAPPASRRPGAALPSGLRVLARSPYLRTLVTLVLLLTVSEGLIDWVFKARAAASMARGEELLRLFAAFYMGISILTVVIQAALSGVALERLGLARSVATLPTAVGLGSVGAILWPGLPSALGLRATESVVSNSLYRAGYEVLFTPVAPREKRAVKPIMDVGAARTGDFLGAWLVQATLLITGVAGAPVVLLLLAIAVSGAAVIVALRLHAGYVRALERGLVSRAIHLDLSEVRDALTRSTVLQSMESLALSGVLDRANLTRMASAAGGRGPGGAGAGQAAPPGAASASPPSPDSAEARAAALASGQGEAARRALSEGPLPVDLVPRAIALLAWDDVARDAVAALRQLGSPAVPALAAALTEAETDFTIRRRIPIILGTIPDASAIEALLQGLADARFEVRYRCGRALSHLLHANPKLGVPPERVYEAVSQEVGSERRVWDSQRLLDQWDDEMWSPLADDVLRTRANRSLEHVFTLLSLALPRQPLRIAYRGLQTEDPLLRGTALEYLETSLPPDIKKQIWPYLEDNRPRRRDSRSPEQALAELLEANESIVLRLDDLRRLEEGPGKE